MPENPIFTKWLKEHSLTMEKFLSVVEGRCAPLPFFPVLPADQQLVARLAYFLPPRYTGRGGGAEAGVLRYRMRSSDACLIYRSQVLFVRNFLYLVKRDMVLRRIF
jgi:hypothetical protein